MLQRQHLSPKSRSLLKPHRDRQQKHEYQNRIRSVSHKLRVSQQRPSTWGCLKLESRLERVNLVESIWHESEAQVSFAL
jgi:hypothetical protein